MRQRLTGLLSVVSAFLVLASCGGGGPTTPSVTPTSITINSTSAFIVLGQTETFTATMAFSNGTTQAVSGGTWGSDAALVATVGAATGLVTSVRSGDVTIFVDAQGIRGTKKITIVPNYQGIWSGTYLVTSCTQTGGFVAVGLCPSVFPIGASLPVAFNLNQTGGNLSGQTALGGVVSSLFLTSASLGGGLVFQAVGQLPVTGPPAANFRIDQAWQINMAVAGQMTGTVVQTWTEPTTTGNMVVGATLQSVTKTSAQPLRLRPQASPGSFPDVVTAIRGR
ncbi:MAG TPA: Ig-like domain-containing protein [Vicinamibacterales bacterium]|nr:Ig-like domain-containing protein [Vicinamibacterales bacterium]